MKTVKLQATTTSARQQKLMIPFSFFLSYTHALVLLGVVGSWFVLTHGLLSATASLKLQACLLYTSTKVLVFWKGTLRHCAIKKKPFLFFFFFGQVIFQICEISYTKSKHPPLHLFLPWISISKIELIFFVVQFFFSPIISRLFVILFHIMPLLLNLGPFVGRSALCIMSPIRLQKCLLYSIKQQL